MATQTPLARANAAAGSKQELVAKVKTLATDAFWVNRTAEDKDKALAHLSNAKLLRLHAIFTEAAKRFGSRADVINAVAEAHGHGKDKDYKKSLERHPLPRLMDMLQSAERRNRRAAAAARA